MWQDVQERLIRTDQSIVDSAVKEDSEAYDNPILINPRIGQGTFRVTVADAYNRRCAITGESTLFVLEAAHIKPYATSHSHKISNGMLLRSDFHTLFDNGHISITPDYEIMVSDSIKDQFNNGKLYYAHQGKKLSSLPNREDWLPNKEYLEWHNAEVFAA